MFTWLDSLKRRFFTNKMLKDITINLTGPICNCESFDLGWGIMTEGRGERANFKVVCHSCKTMLTIPVQQLIATFTMEQSYPKEPDTKNPFKLLSFKKDDPPKMS